MRAAVDTMGRWGWRVNGKRPGEPSGVIKTSSLPVLGGWVHERTHVSELNDSGPDEDLCDVLPVNCVSTGKIQRGPCR